MLTTRGLALRGVVADLAVAHAPIRVVALGRQAAIVDDITRPITARVAIGALTRTIAEGWAIIIRATITLMTLTAVRNVSNTRNLRSRRATITVVLAVDVA